MLRCDESKEYRTLYEIDSNGNIMKFDGTHNINITKMNNGTYQVQQWSYEHRTWYVIETFNTGHEAIMYGLTLV